MPRASTTGTSGYVPSWHEDDSGFIPSMPEPTWSEDEGDQWDWDRGTPADEESAQERQEREESQDHRDDGRDNVEFDYKKYLDEWMDSYLGARKNLFGIFAESPEYQIPDEMSQMLDVFRTAGGELKSEAFGARDYLRNMWQETGGDIVDELKSARDRALGIAREDSRYIRDLQERTARRQVAGAEGMRRDVLGTLRETGETARGLAQQRAYGQYAGTRVLGEQIGARRADLLQNISEAGYGGGAGLGAISNAALADQQAIQQMSLNEAQYRTTGLENLQATEQALGGQYAQAQRATGLDVLETRRTAAQNLTGAYLGTSQYQTGLMGDYARSLTGTRMGLLEGEAQGELATQGMIQNAITRDAAFRAGGLGAMAAEKEKAYQYNQLQPYQRQTEFLINEARRLDPFSANMAMHGDFQGQGYMQYMQGTQGENYYNRQVTNSFSDAFADAAMAGLYQGTYGT